MVEKDIEAMTVQSHAKKEVLVQALATKGDQVMVLLEENLVDVVVVVEVEAGERAIRAGNPAGLASQTVRLHRTHSFLLSRTFTASISYRLIYWYLLII